MPNVPDKIIVHHTASPRDTTTFSQVNEWHAARDFPRSSLGYRVGYHYLILGDGIVQQARRDNEIGAHTIGQNASSIGICLTGDFSKEQPSDPQRLALGNLLLELVARHGILATEIYPHRHFADTECYGKLLPDDWAHTIFLLGKSAFVAKVFLWIQRKILK